MDLHNLLGKVWYLTLGTMNTIPELYLGLSNYLYSIIIRKNSSAVD